MAGEDGLAEPVGQFVCVFGVDAVEQFEVNVELGDGWFGDGQRVGSFDAMEAGGVGLADGPLLAGYFDGGVVGVAEVDLVVIGCEFCGAGVDPFDCAGGAGLGVEGGDDAADLLGCGEQAEVPFSGLEEPIGEAEGVERMGGGGGGADDEGLAILGEEEWGALGDFEQTGGEGWGFGLVAGRWGHLFLFLASIMGRGLRRLLFGGGGDFGVSYSGY